MTCLQSVLSGALFIPHSILPFQWLQPIVADRDLTSASFRRGQLQLERVRQRLLTELEVCDAEGRSLLEYRREMDLLLQEKMAHVEELRQIHADMNAVSGPVGRDDRYTP